MPEHVHKVTLETLPPGCMIPFGETGADCTCGWRSGRYTWLGVTAAEEAGWAHLAAFGASQLGLQLPADHRLDDAGAGVIGLFFSAISDASFDQWLTAGPRDGRESASDQETLARLDSAARLARISIRNGSSPALTIFFDSITEAIRNFRESQRSTHADGYARRGGLGADADSSVQALAALRADVARLLDLLTRLSHGKSFREVRATRAQPALRIKRAASANAPTSGRHFVGNPRLADAQVSAAHEHEQEHLIKKVRSVGQWLSDPVYSFEAECVCGWVSGERFEKAGAIFAGRQHVEHCTAVALLGAHGIKATVSEWTSLFTPNDRIEVDTEQVQEFLGLLRRIPSPSSGLPAWLTRFNEHWNTTVRERPSREAAEGMLGQLREQWVDLVGPALAASTEPVGFTGRKRRRLVVAADFNAEPPWGRWQALGPLPERGSFTEFRRAINRVLAAHIHGVDHIGFVPAAPD